MRTVGIIQNIWLHALSWESLKGRSPWSDACRLVEGRDALIPWRALFEPCELDRPPHSWRPSSLMRPDGASMVLGPFAETKGPRLPGRNPASQKIILDTGVSGTSAMRSPDSSFLLANPKMDSCYTSSICKARTINWEGSKFNLITARLTFGDPL